MGTTVSSPDGGPDPFDDEDHDIDDESQDTTESNPDDGTADHAALEDPSVGPVASVGVAARLGESGSDSSQAAPLSASAVVAGGAAGAAATTQQLSEDSLPRVVAALDAPELTTQLTAAARLRRLLSADDPPIKEAVGRGAVPRLVELLRRDSSPRLQLESAWALTNIASGAPEHVRAVVDGGALSPLCRLLRASDSAVREQAAWALGNIAGDGAKMRDKVLSAGALAPLVRTLRDAGTAANAQGKEGGTGELAVALPQPDGDKLGEVDGGAGGPLAGSLPLAALRTCVWALSNLVRGKPAPPLRAVSSALPVLAELTNVDDEEVLTDVCWALSYLGERSEGVDAVIQTGVCTRLAGLLAASSASVQKSALHAVGNIVAGSQVQAQAALDGGALPLLTGLLSSGDAEVQRLAAWAISNVTAGSSDQIQAVIDQAAVPPLLALLRSPSRAVRKEAAFALVNVTTSPWPQHTHRLVEQGVIEPLCELLAPSEPTDIVTVTLEGLQNILKIGDKLPAEQLGEAKNGAKNNKRSHPSVTSSSSMAAAVVAADGKARMLALCDQHRSGAIHNISMSLLRTYFGADAASGSPQHATATDGGQHVLKEPAGSPPPPAGTNAAKSRGRRGSRPLSSSADVTENASGGDNTDARITGETVAVAEGGVGGCSGGGGRRDKDNASGSEGKAASKSKTKSRASKGGGAGAAATEVPAATAILSSPVVRAVPSALPSAASEAVVAANTTTTSTTVNGQRVEFMVNIKNFTARRNRGHPAGQYSEVFDGKKAGRWRLLSYTHGTVAGKEGEWLSLYVSSADVDELACKHRWSRTVDYSITLVHPSASGVPPGVKKGKGGDEGPVSLSVTRRHTSVVFRGVHNDYEWGCRDFLPSDQVVDQGFLFNDSLLVRVEVELRDDGAGQPLSVLTPAELRAHLAWATENGLPRACLACLTTFACNNGASPEASGTDHKALTAQLATSAATLVSSTCSEEWGTPLHLACIGWRPGNARVVTLLLDCGAPVDALNKHGETPLVLAAREGGQTSVVAALLDRGGNPCICSKGGWSPMSAAASRGRDDVARLLAQRGAPLEEVWPPLSALLEAAKAGHWSTAITLLESGADPEVQDEKGNTALWILLEKNMTEAALKMVQRHHASVAQCSRERSKVQRAKLLLKHAQRRNGAGAGKGALTKGGLGELGEGLLDDNELLEDEAVAINGGEGGMDGAEAVALDAEAAALALMSELEEEENNKATKSSKNKKKKDKAKAKKQQQTEQEKAKAKEQETASKEREVARKRDEDTRRTKERREFEEKALRDREAAKLQWQQDRIEERDRTDLQHRQRRQEQEHGGDEDSSLQASLSLLSVHGDWGEQRARQEHDTNSELREYRDESRGVYQKHSDPVPASPARSKKRRNSGGEGDGEVRAANSGARSVMPTHSAVAFSAKPPEQSQQEELQRQQEQQQLDLAELSLRPQQQQQQQQQQQHGLSHPTSKAREGPSPWGAPSSSMPSPSLATSAPTAPPLSLSPGSVLPQASMLGMSLGASPFLSHTPAGGAPASAIGAERKPSSSSFTMSLPSGPDETGMDGWPPSPPSAAAVGVLSNDMSLGLGDDEGDGNDDDDIASPVSLKDALLSLGQLGGLLSRHLTGALLASAAPLLARRQIDYATFLMMSEVELFGLGLERDAVATLLEVQEEEVLSGVGGMGFMDDDDDDDGGGGGDSVGMSARGAGMDFLLGDDMGSGDITPGGDDGALRRAIASTSLPGDPRTARAAPCRRETGDEGGVPETPAVAVVRHEVLRGMMLQMRDIEERLLQTVCAQQTQPTVGPTDKGSSVVRGGRGNAMRGAKAEADKAPALASDEDDLGGFVFVCSSDTCAEALETGIFGLPGSHLDDLVEAVTNSTPVFLFNFSDGTLHGAWVADGRPAMNLSPSAFSSPNRSSSRFPAQLRVKRSEDSATYPYVTLRLDEENLSFTSKLAGHWSWFGVPGAISKAHTRSILDKMRERQSTAAQPVASSEATAASASSIASCLVGESVDSDNMGRGEGCSVAAAVVADSLFRSRVMRSPPSDFTAASCDQLLPEGRSEAEVARVAKVQLARMVYSVRGRSEAGEEEIDAAAVQVARCCLAAVEKIKEFSAEENELRSRQGHRGDLDEVFSVASVPASTGADEAGVVEVCWTPPPFFSAAVLEGAVLPSSVIHALPHEYSTFVSVDAFRSLSLAYTAQGLSPRMFLPRLFELVMFYESLACCTTQTGGGFGAFELSLPETFTAAAQRHCGARPLLVSPLDSTVPRPCLGTARVDACWGSEGVFTDLRLDGGSFLLHLPACWTQGEVQPLHPHPNSPVAGLLRPVTTGFALAEDSHSPLSFAIVVSLPAGTATDDDFFLLLDPLLAPYLRRSVLVPNEEYGCELHRLASCASGPPRLTPAGTSVWASAVHFANFRGGIGDGHGSHGFADDGADLALCFLQNDTGALAWPITQKAVDGLCSALSSTAMAAAGTPLSAAAMESLSLETLNTADRGVPIGFNRGEGEGGSKAGGISWAKVVKAGK